MNEQALLLDNDAKRVKTAVLPLKRVLFVDDDQNILDGLKRTLHSMRTEWQMARCIAVLRRPRTVERGLAIDSYRVCVPTPSHPE